MPYLSINGVEFEAAAKSGTRTYVEGDQVRAIDGTLRTSRTRLKRQWEISSLVLTRAEADAWAALLNGRGHVFRFTDEYSTKGLAKTSVTGAVTYNVAGGKYDKKVQLAVGANVKWTPTGDDAITAGGINPKGDYTLMVWRFEAAVARHYVIRSLDGVTNKWKDGVSNDGAATPWLTSVAGVVQLSDGVAAEEFSDMVLLPFGIPTAWAVLYGVRTTAFPSLPKVEASGDLLSNPTTPVTARGTAVKEQPAPHTADYAGKSLDFQLGEV